MVRQICEIGLLEGAGTYIVTLYIEAALPNLQGSTGNDSAVPDGYRDVYGKSRVLYHGDDGDAVDSVHDNKQIQLFVRQGNRPDD